VAGRRRPHTFGGLVRVDGGRSCAEGDATAAIRSDKGSRDFIVLPRHSTMWSRGAPRQPSVVASRAIRHRERRESCRPGSGQLRREPEPLDTANHL
jgi:hypothetical protein